MLEEGFAYEDVRRQLVSELSPWGLKSLVKQEDQASFSMVRGEFGELTSTGTILPAIFMMISVFMLYVVMKKMIDRDQSILGTMKAFGMTDGEMLSAYLLEGLLIGVLGAAIGAATAGILGRYMFALYVEFFNLPDPVYHDYAESRLLGLGLAAGTSGLAVFLGVRNVLGITPAMAMRPKAAEAGNYFELPEQLRRRMSAMGRMPRVFMTGCGCAEPALFLSDKAGKWQPCLHERTISGQRTSSGQAARCPLRVGWAG